MIPHVSDFIRLLLGNLTRLQLREALPEQELPKPWYYQDWLDPPPLKPYPGTLVDLTTKAHLCDSQHFDKKSA